VAHVVFSIAHNFGDGKIETLDQINDLSNERQQLWRMAHRKKNSADWWARHDRIVAIGKRLERLWATHRNEVAATQVWETLPTDRLNLAQFDDFHARGGGSAWRIEDETAYSPHWMTIEQGVRDNQYAHYLKKPTGRRAIAPKTRPKPVKTLQWA